MNTHRDTTGGCIEYDYHGRKNTHRIRYWGQKNGQYRRISHTVHGTHKDAQRKRIQLIAINSTTQALPTVGEIWETNVYPIYLQRTQDGTLANNTLTMYQSYWEAHIKSVWQHIPIDKVRPLLIQQWLQNHPSAYRAAKIILNAILEYAVCFEMIDNNPMRLEYFHPNTSQKRKQISLNSQQLYTAWKAIRNRWIEPAFLLMAFGSCRPSEALAIHTEECRYENGIFLAPIKRQVLQTQAQTTNRLKTNASHRTIAIAGLAGKRLWELCRLKSHGALVSNKQNRYITRDKLLNAFRQTKFPQELPRFTPRDLRSSWQTLARWELGLPPWITERMMGHKGQGVTAQHYDRPQAEQFRDILAKAYAQHRFDKNWIFD